MNRSDTFRMSPVSLFALIGGVFAFFVVGAIIDVLWVAIGAAIGAGVGTVVRRYGRETKTFAEAVDLRESATKEELYSEAQRLDVAGRSSMNRDELAQAVAEKKNQADAR